MGHVTDLDVKAHHHTVGPLEF